MAATPNPIPTATNAPSVPTSGDISLPASITGVANGTTTTITNASMLVGFSGAHTFGRGGKTTFTGGQSSPVTQINDCKLIVGATDITLQGGGFTFKHPLVGPYPNQTYLDGLTPPGPVSIQRMTFSDLGGNVLTFQTFAGRVANVEASSVVIVNNTGVLSHLTCNLLDGTGAFTDRSLDTFTIPQSALSLLSVRAGTQAVATFNPAYASDLGGASGKANLGLGFLNGQLVTDCTASVANGVFTITGNGGALVATSTLGGSAGDSIVVVTIAGQPTEYEFEAYHVNIFVNQFGDLIGATGSPSIGGTFICPGGG